MNRQTHNTSKRQLFLISASLVLLILVAYEPLRHNNFVDYDDTTYIVENPHIQSGFTRESFIWAFTSGYAANWHPLTWLSHMMDIELFGLHPLGHHLHNLVLHIIAAVLLFIVLHKMTGDVWCSAFVAMAFGIHPLRVESVAWAAERKDVLCALFWMLTIAAYVYYARRGGVFRYLGVILCFALGLMTKPMLLTMPIILLLLDWWPLRRTQKWPPEIPHPLPGYNAKNFRSMSVPLLITEKIPFLILAFASCLITYKIHQNEGSISSNPFFVRFLNAMTGYTGYISKTFLPVDLAVLYPFPPYTYPLLQPTISFVAMVTCSGLVMNAAQKRPYILVGWLWYAISLVPVIGFIQAGSQTMADRYSYLPSIGILMIISWATMELTAKWQHKKIFSGILSGLVLVVFVIGTRIQLTYWKDSITLYEHTLSVTRDNLIIQNNLSRLLLKLGKFNEAADLICKTLRVFPDSPDANINMASLFMARGQIDNAQDYLQKAIDNKSDSAVAYYNMGLIFETKNQFENALNSYEQSLKLDRNNFQALNRIGILKSSQNCFDEAIALFRKSISINPLHPEAYRNLAWLLAAKPDSKIHNPLEAIQSALKACQLTAYKKPEMLDTLAVAYAAAGRFEEAIITSQKAMELARTYGKTDLAEDVSGRLQLYQDSKPYHEPLPQK